MHMNARQIIIASFLVIGVIVVWQVWLQGEENDQLAENVVIAEQEKEAVKDEATELKNAVLRDCRSGKPTLKRSTCQAALQMQEVIRDVEEIQDPEIQDTEINDPDPDDPEIQESEIQNPEKQNPERQNPESNDLDPNDPESQDVEFDDPELQDDEFDDPEIQEPEIDDPEPDDPEQQDPEQDDPDPNDEPVSPYPFTFTFDFMGMTFICTIDSPDNNVCESEPSPSE